MPDDGWQEYLSRYHESHPGITEAVLTGSPRRDVGTAYEWLRSAIPEKPGRVVDLACGSAPMHPLFAGADSYIGVDVSDAELAVAAARGRGPLTRADARDLPLDDSCADVVVCSMAIMLLQPVEAALGEVARILRPGGLFVTIRPVGWPVHASDLRIVLTLLLGLRHLPEMPQRFGGRTFNHLLAGAGFDVVDDRALRFAHPLAAANDAVLAVEALHLPHVPDERRVAAAHRLARIARPGREVPVAIRRTVAAATNRRPPATGRTSW